MYSAFSGLNSGNAGIKKTVRQANSFEVGNVVRLDGTLYVKAIADSSANAEAVGVIEACNSNSFTVVFAGEINLGSIDTGDGTTWFLSATLAGGVVSTAPSNTGTIQKAIYIGTGNNRAIIVNYLGLINGLEEGGDTVSLAGVSPVGQIIPFAGPINNLDNVPDGWLLCDGTQFSSTEYPELALLLGNSYGDTSGNLYRLPDLRGRTPLGVNQDSQASEANTALSTRVLGASAGLEEVQLSTNEMPSHAHTASYLGFADEYSGYQYCENTVDGCGPFYGPCAGQPSGDPDTYNTDVNPNYNASSIHIDGRGPILSNDWCSWTNTDDYDYGLRQVPSLVNIEGGGAPHNNMSPYLVTNWLIRADSRMPAKILTVTVRGMADVDDDKGLYRPSGGVMVWNSSNDGVTFDDAEEGDDKFIVTPLLTDRNVIINGNFEVWQRGTSHPTFSNGAHTYLADRFTYSQSSNMSAAGDIHKGSGNSPNHPFNLGLSRVPGENSLIYDCQTTQPTLAATDYSHFNYHVEGYDFGKLWASKYMTLSFWTASNLAGTYCVSFRNKTFTRSYVAEYTIPEQDKWYYRSITVPIDNDNYLDWHFGKEHGLRIGWTIASGTGYHTTTPNTWVAGNAIATANQANGVGKLGVGASHDLAQVQLEAGRIATPFESMRISDTVERCQRYFEKSYPLDHRPGTATYRGSVHADDWVVGSTAHIHAPFKTRKRHNTPSCVVYDPTSGVFHRVYMVHKQSGTSQRWNATVTGRSDTSIDRIKRTSGNFTSGYKNKLNFHWTADAELY